MTSVTITGSGTPHLSATRAGPGVLVQTGDVALQFDAGRSTVQRLAACGILPSDLDAVFVTHHHSDHLTAMRDLVLTRWTATGQSDPPLPTLRPRVRPWRFYSGCSTHGTRTSPYAANTRHGTRRVTKCCRSRWATGATSCDVVVYEAMRFEFGRQLPPEWHFMMDHHADTTLIGAQMAALGVPTLILTHLIPAPGADEERRRYVDDVLLGDSPARWSSPTT